MKQIRRHVTYANVMSSLAVFMILGGATAVAATKIGANEIKANSIKTGKIVKEAVTAGKIKKNAVTESRIADGAVTTNKLADNSVTTNKLANDAVTGEKVKESTLGEVPLAANASNLAGLPSTAYQSRVRWALVNSAANGNGGQILAQSGGISVAAGLPGFSYLDWGESIANKNLSVSIAQITEGFITVTPCGGATAPAGTTCAPAGTDNANHTIVRMDTAGGAATNQIYFISVTS